MRFLFLSGREPTYTRNSILLQALSHHAEVINISPTDRSYPLRFLKTAYRFLTLRRDYDIVFVGFYGQPLVLFLRLFTRKPLLFDAYISTFQTLCVDRKTFSPDTIPGKMAFFLDKWSCRLADHVILDTQAHIQYFVDTFGLDPQKFTRIFVGADETVFGPLDVAKGDPAARSVFFYSEYQPLHGVEHIVGAAKLLERERVHFTIVGKGREKERVLRLAEKLQVRNITFEDWVPYELLPQRIAEADLCIGGHLGNTQKAAMVIAGKTFQFIAMRKPALVALNPANKELFGEDGDFYVIPGDPKSLAKKIKQLIFDPDRLDRVAGLQHGVYKVLASTDAISREMDAVLRVLSKPPRLD